MARPLREQFAIATLVLLIPVGAVMTWAAGAAYNDQLVQLLMEAQRLASAVAAHIEQNGEPSGPRLEEFLRAVPRFRVVEDGPGVTAELLRLLAAVTVQGRQVHDANIVATMLAHGVPNLLTHNAADFARYAPAVTVLPLVPLAPPGAAPGPPAPGGP